MADNIIGYDAREMWLAYDERWTVEQRRGLLRSDLVKPLAVDRVIWPSVFETPVTLAGGSEWWDIPNPIPMPPEIRTREFLWNDRDAMLGALERGGIDRPVWAIALTLAWSAGVTGQLTWPGTLPSSHDILGDALDPNWLFLGYDVAEPRLWSALAGLTPQGADPAAWAGKLNGYHLFAALDDARAYADDARRRQPTRAPFEVFGLYRVAAL